MTALHALLGFVANMPTAEPAASPGSGFEVDRYDVALRPDLETGSVSGVQTISVRITGESVRALAFSPNALQIADGTSDRVPIEVASRPDAVVFHLPKALRRGQRTNLRFNFKGVPARGITKMSGGLFPGYFACD